LLFCAAIAPNGKIDADNTKQTITTPNSKNGANEQFLYTFDPHANLFVDLRIRPPTT
jgi:hypothetical protein